MKNQIYRLHGSDDYKLEFYIAESNELNPDRDIDIIGVTAFKKGSQIDFDLEEQELDSFIDFLIKCKTHISEFNQKTKKPKN